MISSLAAAFESIIGTEVYKVKNWKILWIILNILMLKLVGTICYVLKIKISILCHIELSISGIITSVWKIEKLQSQCIQHILCFFVYKQKLWMIVNVTGILFTRWLPEYYFNCDLK